MKKILFIATVYRCGEKIYPIIPYLCNKYQVDVFGFNQMSSKTPWHGNNDPRWKFYDSCELYGANFIVGPNDAYVAKNYNNTSIAKKINYNKYDLIILDDNKLKGGWGTPILCRLAKKHGVPVIASPHGNHEFSMQNLEDNIGKFFDYSFVFGDKEKNHLCSLNKKVNLFPAGIPSNDILKNYPRGDNYILVVTGYVEKFNSSKKNKNGYLPFNENALIDSGVLELSKIYNKPILIKEKSRFKRGLGYSLKHLEEKYDNVSVIMDHEDDNKLIADASFLISAPSTLCFKAIQLGIPTVLLKGFGMEGNFYDFSGLVDLDKDKVLNSLQYQLDNGKECDFLKRTLAGSLEFNATELHLNYINRILL